MTNQEIAVRVLELVGGAKNVKNVYHCATRLRFTLQTSESVQTDALKQTDGVLNVLGSGTQIQVVIGNNVNKVYNELMPLLPATGITAQDQQPAAAEKGRPLDRIFNAISGIFAPYLPLLMCSGIITGLLSLASSMNWIDTAGGTYAVLSAASNTLFYFFPILLSFTAAKQFHTNPFVAVMIGGALIHPTFMALSEVEGGVTFLGIPLIMQSYTSTVLPAIAGVGLYALVDHKLSKVLPDSIRNLVITLVGMVVVVPLAAILSSP